MNYNGVWSWIKSLYAVSQEARIFTVICIVVIMSGAVGGLAGGLYRNRHQFDPNIQNWKDWGVFALCGIISAFGMVALCNGISSFFASATMLSKGVSIIGVSLLSGFFAMRLLPHLGARLEKELGEMKEDTRKISDKEKLLDKRTSDLEAQAADANVKLQEAHKIADDFRVYSGMISTALAAISTQQPSDKAHAIKIISKDISRFKTDRTLNIIYARLLRKVAREGAAIDHLITFAEHVRNGAEKEHLQDEDREAIGTAYFNVACYFNARKDNVEGKYNAQTREYLVKAFEYMPVYSHDWHDDPDLHGLPDGFI